MKRDDFEVTENQITEYKKRGYNDDLLPKTKDKRNMGAGNYFTLWMGSIHNIPNYAAVGGFLFLGLSPLNVMIALFLSAFFVSAFMSLNGIVGSKYGIPFAMHLRSATETLVLNSQGSCGDASLLSPGLDCRRTPVHLHY